MNVRSHRKFVYNKRFKQQKTHKFIYGKLVHYMFSYRLFVVLAQNVVTC